MFKTAREAFPAVKYVACAYAYTLLGFPAFATEISLKSEFDLTNTHTRVR